MRVDRCITLGVARPVLRASSLLSGRDDDFRTGRRVLPVLMYHSISGDSEDGVDPYFRVATSPERFRAHMNWLAELGWVGVTLGDGLKWRAGELDFPKRPVAITFDDGFRDFRTNAFPVLRDRGFRATMHVPTGLVGGKGCFMGRDCLDWGEIRSLHGCGIEFGSHTVSHPVLYNLPWFEIRRELVDSKARIEEELGEPVRIFSYPFAFPQPDRDFTRLFTATLEQCGYQTCTTTTIGRVWPSDSRFAVRRLPANDCDDRLLLEAKLSGAYDWLAKPQGLYKALRFLGRRPKVRSIG